MFKKLFCRKDAPAPEDAPKLRRMTQAEFDARYVADVKVWRDCAEAMGCDMTAFDSEIALRKSRLDILMAKRSSRG